LFIAQQGWLRTGKPFLDSLVEFLGRTLDVAYVLVDELLPSGSRARSIALYANGEPAHNIEYDLAFTPCENVMNKRLCCYPDGLRERFPEDALLVQMKAESYMGIPLWDSKGVPLGLIAIMDTRPLSDVELMKEVIQTVALRTAHELERRRDDARLAAYYADLESTVAERTADLHDANKRLEEANKEIVSVNEKLRTMTGMVSHDIANQLLVLNGKDRKSVV
jgi:GAF domain-containing protein